MPLTFHVAEDEDGPVAGEAFLARQLESANELFAGSSLRVAAGARRRLGPPGPDIMTAGQRHRLAPAADRNLSIHVFVVRRLADKDVEGAFIRGVHWRYRGGREALRGRRYIILAADAPADTLAHELGHYFGLRHVEETDNLMSYSRAGGPVYLTATQLRRVDRHLGHALRTGLLERRAP